MARRLGKGAGERSYAAHRKRQSEATGQHRRPNVLRDWIIVATCSGSVRPGPEIGLPPFYIDVPPDPLIAGRVMREARHGALGPSASPPGTPVMEAGSRRDHGEAAWGGPFPPVPRRPARGRDQGDALREIGS